MACFRSRAAGALPAILARKAVIVYAQFPSNGGGSLVTALLLLGASVRTGFLPRGMAVDRRSRLRSSFRTGGSPLVGDQRRIPSARPNFCQRREFACTKQMKLRQKSGMYFSAVFFSSAGASRPPLRVGSTSMAAWQHGTVSGRRAWRHGETFPLHRPCSL
jgi:hypothetical protein